MSEAKERFTDKVCRFSVPHVLILILLIILICCGLTYIVPAGLYDIDPQQALLWQILFTMWKAPLSVRGEHWLK